METFGKFILNGRLRAGAAAFIFALVPLMGWLSQIIMSLVTLRKGPLEGFFVLLWAMLPGMIIAYMNQSWMIGLNVVIGSAALYVLSILLRQTVSWSKVVISAIIFGIVLVTIIHLVVPDIVAWWHDSIVKYLQVQLDLAKTKGLSAQEIERLGIMISVLKKDLTHWFPSVATGLVTVVALSSILIHLGLSRWWQAAMFNPGGLQKELHGLRFNWLPVLLLAICGIAIFAGLNFVMDYLPLLLLLFIVSSLTLAHTLATIPKTGILWLIVFYIGVIIASPYSLMLLVVVGILDCLVDFRYRFGLATVK